IPCVATTSGIGHGRPVIRVADRRLAERWSASKNERGSQEGRNCWAILHFLMSCIPYSLKSSESFSIVSRILIDGPPVACLPPGQVLSAGLRRHGDARAV